MMTREEVAEIMNYCKEYKVTYKSRLEELNIPVWRVFMTANPVMPPSNHRVKRLKVSLSSFHTADLLFRFFHLFSTTGRKQKSTPTTPSGLKEMEIRTPSW
ncbi:hypothetical protein NXX77_18285 [Phocaeicola dorei]|nr:hypothetical protein [Phocaeicola dorei]